MHAIYIKHYLTDEDVANIARQSFAKLAENFTEQQNNSLVRFLARGMSSGDWESLIHQMMTFSKPQDAHELAVYIRSIPEHWVPFGHPHITLRMSAPVPIARQAFKHKIGFVESEESRRYISSTPKFYTPDFFRTKAANVKQGSTDTPAELSEAKFTPVYTSDEDDKPGFIRTKDPTIAYTGYMHYAIKMYETFISDGICPEQARFILPQGCEVNWVWTGSLYAFANYYNQRTDPHSQKESRDLAEEVGKIIAPLFPVSWAALTQGTY